MTLTRPRARIQCDNAEGSIPPIEPSWVLLKGIRWMGCSMRGLLLRESSANKTRAPSVELLLAERTAEGNLRQQ